MTPDSGARLDGYELVRVLGTGGMGEVWLATDVDLRRRVALKLLPSDFANDTRRVARFEQEARAASALSHPNICHVYALGQTGAGQRYIAMELVEGATLRTRLQTDHLSLAEALRIAGQIAAAVSAAHAAGIIHRDLKPENVIVRPDGLVKVLDFGLAKLSPLGDEAAAGEESTQTVVRTDAGTVVGTVAYMSPEQARGQVLDARTDIWSLGVMLYEAVAGRRPFGGRTSTDVLAAILEHEADPLTRFEPQTPDELTRIVNKSLRKERSERYQTMADVALDLEALRDQLHVKSKSSSGPVVVKVGQQSIVRRGSFWAAVAAVAILGAVGVWWVLPGAVRPAQTGSAAPVLRSLTRLTFGREAGFATFSPDAGRIAFFEQKPEHGSLWVQSTAGGNLVEITKLPWDFHPDWSPDGNSITFERIGEGIRVVSQLGGQERRVAAFGEWPKWSPDGSQILFSTDPFSPKTRLFLAAPDQAPRQVLASFLEGGSWYLPAWHPDGRITITGRHKTEGFGIFTISVRDGRWIKTRIPTELLKESNIDPEAIWTWCWAPSAHFLYATCTARGVMNIWRLRMDSGLQVTGTDRLTNGAGSDWAGSLSRDGTKLLFSTITGNSRLWSFPFNAETGQVGGAGQALSESDGEVNWSSLSPDGRRLAYFYEPLNAGLRQSELRLMSFPFTGTPETIPADRYVRMASAWSHKGDRLALQGAELGSAGNPVANLLIIRERAGTEQVIARCENSTQAAPCAIVPFAWTPDDSAVLASSTLGNQTTARLGLWPTTVTAPSAAPRDILVSDPDWNISQATYSPDGKWLAFAYGRGFNDEKGIAVIPASGHAPKASWRSIAEGAKSPGNPRWSPDGRALYFTAFLASGMLGLWRVGIMPSTGAQVGVPTGVMAADNQPFLILNRSYYPTIAVGADRLVLPLNSQQIAVWMLDKVDR